MCAFDLKESALNKENCKEVKWSGSALIYSKKKVESIKPAQMVENERKRYAGMTLQQIGGRYFLPGREDNGQGRRGRKEVRERGKMKWCRHRV